jgi:hypothetical protein
MSEQKGNEKCLDVEVIVELKEGGKPSGRVSGENGKQRWLVWLVGADGKLEANDVEKTSRMINIQQERDLPANVRSFSGWLLRMTEASRSGRLAMTTRASRSIAETSTGLRQTECSKLLHGHGRLGQTNQPIPRSKCAKFAQDPAS